MHSIFMLSILISLTFMILPLLISMNHNKEKPVLNPFECGFNPMFTVRNPFSIQFFLIAILFMIFDIEIILILPIPISTKTPEVLFSTIIIFMILMLGLMYEWVKGSLNWL